MAKLFIIIYGFKYDPQLDILGAKPVNPLSLNRKCRSDICSDPGETILMKQSG